MVKKGFLAIFLVLAMTLVASSAMAATSVSWLSPPDGSSYPVGTIVNPTGAASAQDVGGGTGLDLALVLDESGSMGTTKMQQAKDAAIALVNALPEDTTSVAVIGFDYYSHTYRTLTPLNPDKSAVIAAINSIYAGGGTSIGAGITAATSAINLGHTDGRSKMMVVLSDGISSTGVNEASIAWNNYQIQVHTVAIPSADLALMQSIATAGNGVFTNVSDTSTLTDIFAGTGGNLVGIDHVDIELPDGTMINSIVIDGLGNFILPDWVIDSGINEFIATAYGTDGTSASATLTLNGVSNGDPVPEPATLILLGTGLVGLVGASRKKLFKK